MEEIVASNKLNKQLFVKPKNVQVSHSSTDFIVFNSLHFSE